MKEYPKSTQKPANPTWLHIPHSIVCVDCGQTVEVRSIVTKRCPECRKVNASLFYAVRHVRSQFASVAEQDPETAKRLHSQMVAEEGPDFAELALDGIPDRMLHKKDRRF